MTYNIQANPDQDNITVTASSGLKAFSVIPGAVVSADSAVLPYTQKTAEMLYSFLKTGEQATMSMRTKAFLRILKDNKHVGNPKWQWDFDLHSLRDVIIDPKSKKLHTAWDLIHYMPLRYIDKSSPQNITDLNLDMWCVVVGEIIELKYIARADATIVKIRDITGATVTSWFFRQRWLVQTHSEGDTVVLSGVYSLYTDKRTGATEYRIVNATIDKVVKYDSGHKVIPVYSEKVGKKKWVISKEIEKMLGNIGWIEDPVPEVIIKKYDLMTRNEAYRKIHFPDSLEEAVKARERIAFDDFVRLQVFLHEKKNNEQETRQGNIMTEEYWAEKFVSSLPFDFTGAQNRVVDEIKEDMNSSRPMRRLLHGDVGSGKAQPLYSLVLTPEGFKTMGDMQVGQEVLTPSGKVVKVEGLYPQGERPVYELEFSDGSKVRADQNHLWLVYSDESPHGSLLKTLELASDLQISMVSKRSKWFVKQPDWAALQLVCPSTPTGSEEVKWIVSVTSVGIEPTQCIKLDNAEGLYITDHYTITHNTEVALNAALRAVSSGFQVALLAPTSILATQLWERFERDIEKTGLQDDINVGLLHTGVKVSQKRKLLADLESGELNILIGTHSILSKGVVFNKLGLILIDEQHKFGTKHRQALSDNFVAQSDIVPDVLMMSATPIPRTMSQTIYGDMDFSVIDEYPANRKPVATFWDEDDSYAWDSIREQVAAGHQAYVIASLVEESESEKLENVENATQTHQFLQTSIFPDINVGLVHGKMKAAEKNEVLEAFYSNEIQVLVSTSVIEVGVNVPNATVMTILNANRFGIASLHQIRGRVGRGDAQGYCYLIGEASNPDAEERLNAMVASNDGFWLAEKDLEIRGEGSLMKDSQSGENDMIVANLREHKKLLEIARRVAKSAAKSPKMRDEVTFLFGEGEISS